MANISKMMVPALVAGVLMAIITGFFSALDEILSGVGVCNCLCCLWLMGGGALAAYMLQRSVGKIELKDGAIVGVLSGVIFAVLATIFDTLLLLLDLGDSMAPMQQALDQAGIESGLFGVGVVIGMLFVFVIIYLIWGMIFCTVGGVIAAKLLEKNVPKGIAEKSVPKVTAEQRVAEKISERKPL